MFKNITTVSYRVVTCAFLLALVVVTLGAYTRLTHAGLSCPDWPGCYQQWVVPSSPYAINKAMLIYPNTPVEASKAWTEMVHRYVAGTLGLLIMGLALLSFLAKSRESFPRLTPALLVCLVLGQATLGMWTVTLQLFPPVVMGHLLGGFSIVSLLWLLRLQLATRKFQLPQKKEPAAKTLFPWVVAGLVILCMQVALGGWVSANYAGMACIGFPWCNGQVLPAMNFTQAFNLFAPIGANYQGGLLDSSARVAIQMVHRIGALVTFCYLVGLSAVMLKRCKSESIRITLVCLLTFLAIQIMLGILNVTHFLPLSIAVSHHAVAAMLLLAMVTLTYRVYHARV